jgi:hypothetical protein
VPRIPGVPTLDPVSQPTMSPQEAGRPGEAVSQLGEVSNDATLQQQNVDLFMKKAQQSVDETAFQNQAHASMLKYQAQLEKTTNSRDVADVTKQAQDDMNALVKQWGKSPALIQIQQQADGLIPQLQYRGVMRTGELQVKESAVESKIQKQNLLPQLVNATRNGDKATVDFINAAMDNEYAKREAAGLISHADVELEKNADQIQFRQQLNQSYISSADPKERLAAIAQLKTGGSGPLNLEGLAAGDVAALRYQAESKNRELNNLAEAGNLNNALNVTDNAFAAPEYKNNYEARINSLQDGDWLIKHGIVSEDGQPDRVMAEKLIAETTRQRAEAEKIQTDKDNKGLEQLDPLIEGNKLSHAQLIAKTKDFSARAQSIAETAWYRQQASNRAVSATERSIRVAERQESRAEEEYASGQIRGRVSLEMNAGKVYEPMDIREIQGLTDKDRGQLIAESKDVPANPYIQDGKNKISELGILDENKYELARVFLNQVKEGDLRGGAITDLADKLIKQAKTEHSQNWINQLYRKTTEGRRPDSSVDNIMSAIRSKNAPDGATMQVPDKKTGLMHWSDGKRDLGVVK